MTGQMRLFHFSDDPAITAFRPRPVAVPSQRPPGLDWLNGSLVWAIDEAHQAMYLFPRDCPRILVWSRPDTSAEDRDRWFGHSAGRIIAHIEWDWLARLRSSVLYRYALPPETFEPRQDAGMWVSRQAVTPITMDVLSDLPAALCAAGVELRVMERLTPLREIWSSSLQASGIRLRNAQEWRAPSNEVGNAT